MFLKLAFLALAATGGALVIGMGTRIEEKKSNESKNSAGGSEQSQTGSSTSGVGAGG